MLCTRLSRKLEQCSLGVSFLGWNQKLKPRDIGNVPDSPPTFLPCASHISGCKSTCGIDKLTCASKFTSESKLEQSICAVTSRFGNSKSERQFGLTDDVEAHASQWALFTGSEQKVQRTVVFRTDHWAGGINEPRESSYFQNTQVHRFYGFLIINHVQ